MKLIQLWNDMKRCKLHNLNFWVNYFFIFFFLMLYCLFKIWLLSRATLVTFEGCNVQHQTWPKSPSEQEILRLFLVVCCHQTVQWTVTSSSRVSGASAECSDLKPWPRRQVFINTDDRCSVILTKKRKSDLHFLSNIIQMCWGPNAFCPAWSLQMNKWQIRAKLFEEKNKSTLN